MCTSCTQHLRGYTIGGEFKKTLQLVREKHYVKNNKTKWSNSAIALDNQEELLPCPTGTTAHACGSHNALWLPKMGTKRDMRRVT